MQWFIEKVCPQNFERLTLDSDLCLQNKRYKDGEPQYVEIYLDEREDDVERNGNRLSDKDLDIYTCEHEQAPDHPDTPRSHRECYRQRMIPIS